MLPPAEKSFPLIIYQPKPKALIYFSKGSALYYWGFASQSIKWAVCLLLGLELKEMQTLTHSPPVYSQKLLPKCTSSILKTLRMSFLLTQKIRKAIKSAGLIHLKQPISWKCEHLFRIQQLIFLKRTLPLQFQVTFFQTILKKLIKGTSSYFNHCNISNTF